MPVSSIQRLSFQFVYENLFVTNNVTKNKGCLNLRDASKSVHTIFASTLRVSASYKWHLHFVDKKVYPCGKKESHWVKIANYAHQKQIIPAHGSSKCILRGFYHCPETWTRMSLMTDIELTKIDQSHYQIRKQKIMAHATEFGTLTKEHRNQAF